MTTTVKRLRIAARHDESQGRMMNEAANLIEQQRRKLEGLRVKLLSEEFQQVVDWKDEIKHLHERCERLNKAANEYKQENQKLAAHVERVKQVINSKVLDWARCGVGANYSGDYYRENIDNYISPAYEVMNQSPQTSLAEHDREVRARAVEEFANCLLENHVRIAGHSGPSGAFRIVEAEYIEKERDSQANKIRNGKDGE